MISTGRTISLAVCLACAIPLLAAPAEPHVPAFRAGRIESREITESSGLAASRAHRDVFWTHNDSGNEPRLFAIDGRGKSLGSYLVGAENIDWEDIAIDDKGRLYIADIGNNAANRKQVFIHAVAEPDPAVEAAAPLKVRTTWTLRYPKDAAFDAESLIVTGDKGYLIAKLRNLGRATLYEFDLDPARPLQFLRAVGPLPIRFPVTAADLSADGKWLAVLTVAGPYLFRVDGDVGKAVRIEPKRVTFTNLKLEACAVVADGVLTTTEDRDMYLFRWKDFGIE